MTITVPVWLLWTLGVVVGVPLIFCAVVGLTLLWGLRKGIGL